MIEVRVIDNEYDKTALDVFAGDVLIGRMLKIFYKKTKIPIPLQVEDLSAARSFFYNFEKIRAKEYTLFLLSNQSYHSLQLKLKLKNKLISDEAIKMVLEDLRPYLDDQSWVELKIEGEFKRGNGPITIQKKLYSLGIFVDPNIIKGRISEKTQKDKIFTLIEKKFASHGEFDSKKAYLYLVRKGFDYQLIREVISRYHSKESLPESEL